MNISSGMSQTGKRDFDLQSEKGYKGMKVYAATSPDLEGVTGKVFSKKREKETPPITHEGEALRHLGIDKYSPFKRILIPGSSHWAHPRRRPACCDRRIFRIH
ncbi:MAG: hypothetical protein NWE88_00610 [Candidatus Bathyarchaeota archaeon]|nr:hypothetical protein [Candidatus Bathyarchaeota archaeon]